MKNKIKCKPNEIVLNGLKIDLNTLNKDELRKLLKDKNIELLKLKRELAGNYTKEKEKEIFKIVAEYNKIMEHLNKIIQAINRETRAYYNRRLVNYPRAKINRQC